MQNLMKILFLIVFFFFSFLFTDSGIYLFKNLKNGYWLGEDFLGHSFQDWQIENENAICLTDNKKTKLEITTFHFSKKSDDAEIILDLTIDKKKNIGKINTGIEIGFTEYLKGDQWVGKKGLRIGIFSGQLAIFDGEKKKIENKEKITTLLQQNNQISLRIKLTYQKKNRKYKVILSAISKLSKQQQIIQTLIRKEVLKDNKMFIFNQAPSRAIFYKSVVVRGKKIKFLNDKKVNPIFSPQFIVQKNKLYFNVRFFPINEDINDIEVDFYNSRGVKLFHKKAYVKKGVPSYLFVIDNWKYRVPIEYKIKLNYQKPNDEIKVYQRQGKIKPFFKRKLRLVSIGENNFFYQKDYFEDKGVNSDRLTKDIKKKKADLILYHPNQVDFRNNNGVTVVRGTESEYILDYLYRFYFFALFYEKLTDNISSVNILGSEDFGQSFLWGGNFKQNQFSQEEGFFLNPKFINLIFDLRRGNLKFQNKNSRNVSRRLRLSEKSFREKLQFSKNPFLQEISFSRAKISFVLINNLFYRYSPKYYIKNFNINKQKYGKSLIVKNNKQFLFAPSQIQFLKNWKNEKLDYKKILITSTPFQDFSSLKKDDFFKRDKKKRIRKVNYANNAWPPQEREFLINSFDNVVHFSANSQFSGIFKYKNLRKIPKMTLYAQSPISAQFLQKPFQKEDDLVDGFYPQSFKNFSPQENNLVDGFNNLMLKKFLFSNKKNAKMNYSVLIISRKKNNIYYHQILEENTLIKKYSIK